MMIHRRAFSRMDLLGLLVIALTLLCVIAPAIRAGRQQSSIDRQLSQAKEWISGWKSYTSDNADAVVMAAPPWSWVHPTGAPNSIRMLPGNPWSTGFAGPSINKVYTLHMLPWVNNGLRNIQLDTPTWDAFNARNPNGTTVTQINGQPVREYADTTRPGAFSWHTSLGYNGVFVGGSFRHGAYQDAASVVNAVYTGTNPSNGGHFYVRRASQITNTNLTIFAPARGGDVSGTTFWSYGQSYPNFGVIRPGHWLITPPIGNSQLFTTSWTSGTQADALAFNPARPPSTYGNLDFRLGSTVKTFTASADGAVRIRSLEDVRDMRLWATQATSRNWNWTPGQNP